MAITVVVNAALFFMAETWLLPPAAVVHWMDFTSPFLLPFVMICFFPLAAVLHLVWSGLRPGKTTPAERFTEVAVLFCCTMVTAVWLAREPVNRDTRTIARTVYHLTEGKWENILHEPVTALFSGFPQNAGPLQEFMVHAVDHALSRTGQLGHRLFSYPQAVFSDDPLLMLERTHSKGFANWVAVLELAMELGMVNTAEKIAGELMENMGPYPAIMYRRALVQLAKGNRSAASVYLRRLARMPFYRSTAQRLLRMVDNDEALGGEPVIARKPVIQRMPVNGAVLSRERTLSISLLP